MINRQKVELMARAAEYEKVEGRQPLRLESFFRKGQHSLWRMKNVLFGFAGYLLILLVAWAGIFYTEGSFPEFEHSFLLTGTVIAVGIIFSLVYSAMAERLCRNKYDDVKNSMRGYYKVLERLDSEKETYSENEDTADREE